MNLEDWIAIRQDPAMGPYVELLAGFRGGFWRLPYPLQRVSAMLLDAMGLAPKAALLEVMEVALLKVAAAKVQRRW